MAVTIISVILLIYSLLQYLKGKYVLPIFSLVFFASNAFIFNLGTPILKYKDFGLLLLLGCCFIGRMQSSRFFSVKGRGGAIVSSLFLLFFLFEFLYAYLTNIDTVGNILAVLRDYLYALTYFVFRNAPEEQVKKGIKMVFKGVVCACAVFVIQFFTQLPLTDSYVSEANEQMGNYRMQSTPPYIGLILLTLLFYCRKLRGRWGIIILMFAVFLISQNRTPLIALFLQIGLFLLFAKKAKYKIPIMVAAMLAFPFVSSLLTSRSSQEGGTSNFDVPVMTYLSQGNYQGLAAQSTFMFRIALIAERADYLLSNPEKLPLGVGAMSEDTAQKKFNFGIGTAGTDQRMNIYVNQLQSIDVVWGPLLIRYGFIGLVFHLSIVVWMIVAFYKKRVNPVMMLGFLTYASAMAQSFSSGGMFLLMGIMTMMGYLIVYDRRIELIDN